MKKSIISSTPSFQEVKKWYHDNLHPDANNYDDPGVYRYIYHEGRFPGIFQCTQVPAQKFFMKAKPESIVDIAALTSIWRPGPLSAGVHNIYLDAKKGKKFEWGHPLFDQVLGETYNCILFQEQIMQVAEVIGGFPKDQCDNVRRAILKRDHSKGEAAKNEAKAMEETFIKGAFERGVSNEIAQKAWQQILWMAGYCFNLAHATAYAIDSYMCAFLCRHFETQWLTAYLESMSGNDDGRAKAFADVRSMGYDIVPIDIKYASKSWSVLPGKKLMPALTAAKGVGETAADELQSLRPFNTFEELLWDENGVWRLSKFNKRALEALISVEAFNSLDCVGEGKLFSSYKHMHAVVIEHMNDIKKSSKKDPHLGRKRFFELLSEFRDIDPYTKLERISLSIKHFGTADVNMIISEETKDKLKKKGVESIDDYSEKNLYWFCVVDAVPKKTKNGKKYLMLKVQGLAGKTYKMFMWAWNGVKMFDKYAIVIADVDNNPDFGFSTMQFRTRELES